jgi:recombinational DNA repair ATPase RecF
MSQEKRKYIGWELWSGKFRVRVKGVYVGRYATFDKALKARNVYLKEIGLKLAKGL